MDRPAIELLKNFDKISEVVNALVNTMLDMGGNNEDILRILKDKKPAQKFGEFLLAEREFTFPYGCEVLSVNYELKLVEAMAAPAFELILDDITEKDFPKQAFEIGEQNLLVKLFHFDSEMSSDGVVSVMDNEGFYPATLRELLAYAVKNQNEQRKDLILGLRSVLGPDNMRNVPCLFGVGKALMGLAYGHNDRWFRCHEFLAIHKSSRPLVLKLLALKNFGKMFEVVKVLVNAVLDMGGNDTDILHILKDKNPAQKFAEFLLVEREIIFPYGCEVLSVNYELKLVEAMAAAAFDWKNYDIVEKNFPNQAFEMGEQNLQVKLFHFGRDMSTDGVVSVMDNEGFYPATLRELLAYAVKNPNEQCKYPIVGLRSVLGRDNMCYVPCLGLRGRRRELRLNRRRRWSGYCQFLAVRKSF